MLKLLYLILEYFILKLILVLIYIYSWDKKDIFNNYICRGDIMNNLPEYSCNLFEYSYNSLFWTVSDWITYIIIILTIIIYFIYHLVKKKKL